MTRKLGHTDIGDVSDIRELGSIDKSQMTGVISRIDAAGQHNSMVHIKPRLEFI